MLHALKSCGEDAADGSYFTIAWYIIHSESLWRVAAQHIGLPYRLQPAFS